MNATSKLVSTLALAIACAGAIAQGPELKKGLRLQTEFKTQVLESFKRLKFESTGTNIDWNFATTKFKPNGDEIYVVNPKDVNITKGFPEATHIKKIMNGGESIAYEYLRVDSTTFEYLGNVTTELSHNLVKYNDSQLLLRLPMSVGDKFTDAIEMHPGNTALVETEFVASGNLILPFGTFQNVALIKTTYDYGVIEYKWYQVGEGLRLLLASIDHPDYNYTVAFRNDFGSFAANTDAPFNK